MLVFLIESITISWPKWSTSYHLFPSESVMSSIFIILASPISIVVKGTGEEKLKVNVLISAEIALLVFCKRKYWGEFPAIW